MKHALKASIAALLCGNAADTASSWGQVERNPLLGQTFNGRGAAIKWGLIGASVGLQLWYVKKHPKAERVFVIENFALAGAFGAVAVRNARMEGRQ